MSDTEEKENYDDFSKLLKDLLKDLLSTFPELENKFNEILRDIVIDEHDNKSIESVFNYCKTVYPERFFDILYENEEIFNNEDINTVFLPDIEFKEIWSNDISDKTKKTLWKYLQLILLGYFNSL